MSVADTVFYISLLLIIYVYILYPAVIGLAAGRRGEGDRRGAPGRLSVSVVMAVFNEEASVLRRLAEFRLALASSGLRGEVIVVSDGSTDGTVGLARGFTCEGFRVLESPTNLGKAEALSVGCRAARNEVLVFADARQSWAGDTLGRLLENFADPGVGAVGGDVVMERSPGVLAGVGVYWRYEKWIRRQESRVHSTVGVSGSVSAVRRELFRHIPQGTILDDVYWPIRVVMQGFRVVHDERALAFDRLPDRPRDEFRRKVRTQSGVFQLVARLPSALSPLRNPVWFQFWSHKLGRLAVPWAIGPLLVSGLVAGGTLPVAVSLSGTALILIGLAGLREGASSRLRVVSVASSFLILNAAAWLAFWVWVTGRASRSWGKVDYGAVPTGPPMTNDLGSGRRPPIRTGGSPMSDDAATRPGAPAPLPSDPLRGRDVLCFSGDWGGDPMAMNHLMRLLARDNRVLWVDSIGSRRPTASRTDAGRAVRKLRAALDPVREVEPNLFVLSPLIIPVYDRSDVLAVNRRLLRWQVARAMRRLGFGRPVNYSFLPTAAMVVGDFGEELLIYHCVDEFSAFIGVGARAMAEQEADLIRRSDLVVVTSAPLLRSKAPLNPSTVLVQHGVDFEHFRRALDPETRAPAAVASLPRPVIGFFGLVAADWVDVELLARVADRFPNGSLVVLGRVTTDVSALTCRPNVHLLGQVPYAELPGFCKGFDVGLIPFRINELTLNSNPLKAREYLAAGLPVVSTAIPEVEALGLCRVAADGESFVRQVKAALEDPGPNRARSEAMRRETWEARIDEIRGHLASLVRRGPDRRDRR